MNKGEYKACVTCEKTFWARRGFEYRCKSCTWKLIHKKRRVEQKLNRGNA